MYRAENFSAQRHGPAQQRCFPRQPWPSPTPPRRKRLRGDTAAQTLTNASVAKVQWKAKPFPMPEVRLLPSFWKDTMELNRSCLYSLPNERLAYNFRVTAGIPSDADPLGGWEAPDCELRGHYVGHYLSSCALMHASTGETSSRQGQRTGCNARRVPGRRTAISAPYPLSSIDRLRNHKRVWAPFYTYHKNLAGHDRHV